jgi:hypothetical protein
MQRIVEPVHAHEVLWLQDLEDLSRDAMGSKDCHIFVQVYLLDAHLLRVVDHDDDLVHVNRYLPLELLDRLRRNVEQLEDVLQQNQTKIAHLGVVEL